MSRYSLVKAVVGAGRGTASMESDPSTTRVVDSGDAAVVIERLKADNQRQIEISALEAEVAEIENLNGGVEELENATEEVSELQAAVESRLETGGLTKGEAQFVQCQLNAIARRTGLEANIPSAESFSGSAQDRIDLTLGVTSSMEGILSDAWDAIVKFFKWIGEKIKNLFKSSKKTQESNEEKCNSGEKDAEELKGKTDGKVPVNNESKATKKVQSESKNLDKEEVEALSDGGKYTEYAKKLEGIFQFIDGNSSYAIMEKYSEEAIKTIENTSEDQINKNAAEAVKNMLGVCIKKELNSDKGRSFAVHTYPGMKSSLIRVEGTSVKLVDGNTSNQMANLTEIKHDPDSLLYNYNLLKRLNATYAQRIEKLGEKANKLADQLQAKKKSEKTDKKVASIQSFIKSAGATIFNGLFVRYCATVLPKMIDILDTMKDEVKAAALKDKASAN